MLWSKSCQKNKQLFQARWADRSRRCWRLCSSLAPGNRLFIRLVDSELHAKAQSLSLGP